MKATSKQASSNAPKFTAGKRCELKKHSNFRTMYPIFRNGVLFCFLGMRTGWGRGWQFFPLQLASNGVGEAQIEEFVPNGGKPTSYHGSDGLAGALHALEEGISLGNNDNFKDAREMRAIAKDRERSARKHLSDALSRLREGSAEKCRHRDTLKAMLRGFPVNDAQKAALFEAIEHFESEIRSFGSSIVRAEQELAEIPE
jgi:hypothetical protein